MGSSEHFKGRQYHIGVAPGELAPYILLCGDPARAEKVLGLFDGAALSKKHREFVTFTGTYQGIPVSVMSTGIGVDNTEIAVIEVSRCVERPTFIRIGSCGAIKDGICMGDLVISAFAVPRENASSNYLPEGEIVCGDIRVGGAIENAAHALGYVFHVGGTCSTSSFYGGQCREVPGFPIRDEAKAENVFPALLERGVLNFEMECSMLFTLGKINTIGMRAGCVCAVVAERQQKKGFDPEMIALAEDRVVRTGLEAVKLLAS